MKYTICILCICFIIAYSLPPERHYSLPIRIGLAVDAKSSKDLLIVINSAITSSYNPDELFFHIVACGSTIDEAKILADSISKSIDNCLNFSDQAWVVPFTLPRDSGFYLQMVNAKTMHHWSSSTGADMARFYFGSLFPGVNRILYIDNDVLITCCLEEIWATHMNPNQVVGVALDDLKWATVTQFNRQYNASHPLVIKNIRRNNYSVDSSPLSNEEFWHAVPRYPNDGVLLFDIRNYNKLKVLDTINEIAMANGRGEYAVGMGTQQFTVLGMHDKWIELTPRANLRHFPDMARGYMMWFLYNGLIHFAGQSKPRQVCASEGNVGNEHRLRTYIPWATNILDLQEKCPAEVSHLQVDACWQHIPTPHHRVQFIDFIDKVIQTTKDPSLVYLRIGSGFKNYDISQKAFKNTLICLPKIRRSSIISLVDMSKYPKLVAKAELPECQTDFMEFVDRFILYNASWSARIYHTSNETVDETIQILSKIKFPRSVTLETSYLNDIKRRSSKKIYGSRDWIPSSINYCRYLEPVQSGHKPLLNSNDCVSILDDVKAHDKKHWDVVAVAIDVNIDPLDSTMTSLSVLRALNLEFLRPKFIIVKLYFTTTDTLNQDISEAKAIMKRNGYTVMKRYMVFKYNGIVTAYVCGTLSSVFDFPFM